MAALSSLNDYRLWYYGGQSDAEHDYLSDCYLAGINAYDILNFVQTGGGGGLPVGGTAGQVLTKNTATDFDAGWQTPSGGGGAGLTVAAIQTNSFTAAINTLYPCAPTGSITVTLPTSPVAGSRISVIASGAAVSSTIVVQVTCGGTNRFNLAAGNASLQLTAQHQSLDIIFSGGIWYEVENPLPPGQVPTGGGFKQVLQKNTASNNDYSWTDMDANFVTFSPTGTVSASSVQGAIQELDTEKSIPTVTAPTITSSGGTLASNKVYPVDTTAGSITVSLPATTFDGAPIMVILVSSPGGSICTVNCNTGQHYNLSTGVTSKTLNVPGDVLHLTYNSAMPGWNVLEEPKRALQITSTPVGNIGAVNVQGALAELDAEKLGLTIISTVKTGNYPANPNEFVLFDTTSTTPTLTLPPTPAPGTLVGGKIVIQGGTNGVNFVASGGDVFNRPGGPAGGGGITMNGQSIIYQYQTGFWVQTACALSVGGLDTRYGYPMNTLNAGLDLLLNPPSGGIQVVQVLQSSHDLWTPLHAYAQSDQTINNSAAMQDDAELSVTVKANSRYQVEALVGHVNLTSANGDVRHGFTNLAGATLDWGELGLQDGWTSGNQFAAPYFMNVITSSPVKTGVTGTSSPSATHIYGYLIVGGTGGLFKYRWAQQTAIAEDVTRKAGSWMVLHPLVIT